MPQYEYATVYIDNGTVAGVNAQDFKSKQDVPAFDYFSRLGAEGWRFFQVGLSSYMDCYTALFRRPVPPDENKYEYSTVFAVNSVVEQINGQEYKNKPQPPAAQYMTYLSTQGWDVVGIAAAGKDTDCYTVLLERVKS